ncbi:Hypothetical protein ABZS17G119_04289 (plasmid) [Kosakonia cowanii]
MKMPCGMHTPQGGKDRITKTIDFTSNTACNKSRRLNVL